MKITRRTFIKGTSYVAAMASFGGVFKALASGDEIPEYIHGAPNADSLDGEIKYSVCLNCHGSCDMQAKIKDGVLLKLDGNPYSPMCLDPSIDYATDPAVAATMPARLCARGQAGLQILYDPYRIKQPLKRVGPRGSGKWQAVSWEQAVDEIVEGGNLFGEGTVEGLRAIRSFDPIDPKAPELGPKANQLILLNGRIQPGRVEFTKRWLIDAYGSVNWYDHTTICEQSHHIATAQSLNGATNHLKPDFANSRFVLLFGSSIAEAGFPMNGAARRLVRFKANKGYLAVVDPRYSITASKADKWVPVVPGGDGALAMGMARWIIENNRFDRAYLANANDASAKKNGETTWSDATYLIRLDKMAFLKPEDIGLAAPTAALGSPPKPAYVVSLGGQPMLNSNTEKADIEASITVNGIACKTAFTLLRERVLEYSLDEYARMAGVDTAAIVDLADRFTSHGKKAVADFYRGACQHTNGFYISRAIFILNILIGNFNWKGGYAAGGGTLPAMGNDKMRYNMAAMHPGKVKASGVKISREGSQYEISTEFKTKGYPAKRPWFPFSGSVYQEVIAGIADEYPYACKALILQMGTPAYSSPGIRDITINTLKDTKKVPLFVAVDILPGDTSMYADYILPDVSYMERWETPTAPPAILTQCSKVRQPLVKAFSETKSFEEMLIMLAKKMNLPGYGDNGFGPGMPLNTSEDWYLKLVANFAYGAGGNAVPGAMEKDKVQYVLDRGGRFEAYNLAYAGDYLAHQYNGETHLFVEKVAQTKHSITGKNFDGLPKIEPVTDLKGNVIQDEGDLTLITYKLPIHTQARTVVAPWLMELKPENAVVMNAVDAKRLGIKNGDLVKVTSATHQKGEVGRAQVIEGIRPGVVAVSAHYGHWGSGAAPVVVDGKTSDPDPSRVKGINPNPVMRLDTAVGNVCLEDPIGGSASFNDTKVKVSLA